jgi:hypothetical protein
LAIVGSSPIEQARNVGMRKRRENLRLDLEPACDLGSVSAAAEQLDGHPLLVRAVRALRLPYLLKDLEFVKKQFELIEHKAAVALIEKEMKSIGNK